LAVVENKSIAKLKMYSIIPKTPERGNEISLKIRRKLVVYLILSIRVVYIF